MGQSHDEVRAVHLAAIRKSGGSQMYRPDFIVRLAHSSFLLDGNREEGPPDWVRSAAEAAGFKYEQVQARSLPHVRLKNAKDLLRYARYEAALSDRVRLLAALDECSSLTVAEALMVFRETKPMAGLASMVLHRFVAMELDERLIGPETVVRRTHM